MKNLFDSVDVNETIERINRLTLETKPKWGKMSVDQMLAHCNVPYDMAHTSMYPKPGAVKKFIVKLIAKQGVVGPKPYPANSRTAPEFIISDRRDFNIEKKKLIDYIYKNLELGAAYFENKESHSFGKLTSDEWNVLFAKHLDHHLTQFDV